MSNTTTTAVPFPVTPRQPGEPEADLFGFRLIHRALRSGSHTLADTFTAMAAGVPCSPHRQRAIEWFADHVLTELHLHHSKEDDVLWPVIAVSAGPHIDLGPLTDDHTDLHQLLETIRAALSHFAAVGTDGAAIGELARLFTALASELDEHISDEEATVFPVITQYVSQGDFAKCEKRFTKDAKLPHLLFMLPWLASVCTDEDLVHIRATAPVAPRLLLRLAQGRWTRRRALVVGA